MSKEVKFVYLRHYLIARSWTGLTECLSKLIQEHSHISQRDMNLSEMLLRSVLAKRSIWIGNNLSNDYG